MNRLLMAEILTAKSGDITGSFKPYTLDFKGLRVGW